MRSESLDIKREFDKHETHAKLLLLGIDTTKWPPPEKVAKLRMMPEEKLPRGLSPFAYESLSRARAHVAADKALLIALGEGRCDKKDKSDCKNVWNAAYIIAEKERSKNEKKPDTSRED